MDTDKPRAQLPTHKMAAFDSYLNLVAREAHQRMKRKKKTGNWAQREVGVVVVFAIIGTLALLLIALFIHKKMAARKLAKENAESKA